MRITINQHTKNKDEIRKYNFLSSIEKIGDCWNWTGCKDKDGYGKCNLFGEWRASRVSYIILKGPIQKGMSVLHTCDNKTCVNPDHLFLGTQADNIRDKISKGRQARGETHPHKKFTEKLIRKLRLEYDGVRGSKLKLSKKYGVSLPQVCAIINRKQWKHV